MQEQQIIYIADYYAHKIVAPQCWAKAVFSDVCQIVGGSQPPKECFINEPQDGYIRLIQIRDYKTDKFATYIPVELAKRFCNKDDIMIGRYGPPIFQILRGLEGAYNVALMKAVPNIQLLNKEFLYYFLQTTNLFNYVAAASLRTAGQDGVRKEHLDNYPLFIPPLNEQKRIVAKIEALQRRSQRVKEAIDAIPQLLDQFRQSVLAAAFRGDLTADWRENNPDVEPASVLLEKIRAERRRKWEEAELEKMKAKGKVPKDDKWKQKYKEPEAVDDSSLPELPDGWEWVPVELISTKVVDGVHKKPNYVINGIPFVTVKNLTAGSGISFEEIKYVSIEDHEEFFKRANPERGDILITKDGTLGVVRVIRTDKVFSIFVSVALVKPIAYEMSDYMELAFSCPQMQRQMLGVGIGLMHIHLRELRRYSMPIAPLEEQKEIVCQIQSFLKTIDTIEQQYQETKANLDLLNQSILAKAFRGELVPQNPNDEPASILLERIRAEREKLQQQTKAAKKSKGKTTKRRSKKEPQQPSEAIQLELPGMEE